MVVWIQFQGNGDNCGQTHSHPLQDDYGSLETGFSFRFQVNQLPSRYVYPKEKQAWNLYNPTSQEN